MFKINSNWNSALEDAVEKMGAVNCLPKIFDIEFITGAIDYSNMVVSNLVRPFLTIDDSIMKNLIKNMPSATPINIGGYTAVLYIKDQMGPTYNKAHILNCKTVQNLVSNGKSQRFVTTTDSSGFYNIFFKGVAELRHLDVCQNCTEMLSKNIVNKYNLNQKTSNVMWEDWFLYCQNNSNLSQNSMSQHMSDGSAKSTSYVNLGYTPDWKEISNRVRCNESWTCQSCKVNLSANHELLHCHHFDSNKQNNNAKNLWAVCLCCHAGQPGHDHMKQQPGYKEQKYKLNYIRFNQGLIK